MALKLHDTRQLNSGRRMPMLGFGTWKLEDGPAAKAAVLAAFKAGYRHVDTASIYGNERSVGEAVRESGIARADVFVTTKIWNDAIRQGRAAVLAAFDESLERLNLDYVDLLLLHWPIAGKDREAWKALEQLYHQGKTRSIGVSNYLPHHLDALIAPGVAVMPMVNQIEFHPRLLQPELATVCRKLGIARVAWSPLMQGHLHEVPEVVEIARLHGKTPAQVVLHWCLQHQVVALPRSGNPAHIAENAALYNFELTPSDIAVLDSLDRKQRFGPDPDNFSF